MPLRRLRAERPARVLVGEPELLALARGHLGLPRQGSGIAGSALAALAHFLVEQDVAPVRFLAFVHGAVGAHQRLIEAELEAEQVLAEDGETEHDKSEADQPGNGADRTEGETK